MRVLAAGFPVRGSVRQIMSDEITAGRSKRSDSADWRDEAARSLAVRRLWQQGPDSVGPLDLYLYCVIDAAADERIYSALVNFSEDYEIASLYQGKAAGGSRPWHPIWCAWARTCGCSTGSGGKAGARPGVSSSGRR